MTTTMLPPLPPPPPLSPPPPPPSMPLPPQLTVTAANAAAVATRYPTHFRHRTSTASAPDSDLVQHREEPD